MIQLCLQIQCRYIIKSSVYCTPMSKLKNSAIGASVPTLRPSSSRVWRAGQSSCRRMQRHAAAEWAGPVWSWYSSRRSTAEYRDTNSPDTWDWVRLLVVWKNEECKNLCLKIFNDPKTASLVHYFQTLSQTRWKLYEWIDAFYWRLFYKVEMSRKLVVGPWDFPRNHQQEATCLHNISAVTAAWPHNFVEY